MRTCHSRRVLVAGTDLFEPLDHCPENHRHELVWTALLRPARQRGPGAFVSSGPRGDRLQGVSVIHFHGRGGHRGASSVTVAVSTEFRFGLLFPVYSAGVSPISNLYAAMGTLSARFRAQAKGSRSPQHSTADLERECDMAQIRQRTMAPPAHVVTRTCWRRSPLIACLMLAVSAIVFEMNGHTPGAVNLRCRDLLPAVSLMEGRQFR
jgi:hypothetical protein